MYFNHAFHTHNMYYNILYFLSTDMQNTNQKKPLICLSTLNLVMYTCTTFTIHMTVYVCYTGAVLKGKMQYSKQQGEPEWRVENPHYARGNMKQQEPTEVYSTLVQVGGRKPCDLADTKAESNMYMYVELHKS